MLRPLEVVWIDDQTITPPGPKMVVCIHPENGWYYRINSKSHWRPAVKLVRIPDHMFLKWDSYLECGDPLELDDYIIEQSLRRSGVIGSVSKVCCKEIGTALAAARTLKDIDKQAIREALGI